MIGQLVKLVQDGEELRLSKRAGTIAHARRLRRPGRRRRRSLLARAVVGRHPADARHRRDHPAVERQPGLLRPVRTRAHVQRRAQRALGRHRPRRVRSPDLLTSPYEAALLTALGEFPRVVATAAELRAPHRVARYLEDLAARLPPLVRPLPDRASGRRRDHRRQPHPCLGERGDPRRSRQRPGAARRHRAGADVVMSDPPTPPGPRHADVLPEAHHSAAPGQTSTRSTRRSGRRRPSARRRAARSAASRCPTSSREHGTPALFLDEDDLRGRARAYSRSPSATSTSTTRARRSSAPTVARWIAEEGLGLDVCTGGELAVALAAGFPPSGSRCTATTSRTPN